MSRKELVSAKHSAAVNTEMKNRWSILSGTRSSARIARGLRGYTRKHLAVHRLPPSAALGGPARATSKDGAIRQVGRLLVDKELCLDSCGFSYVSLGGSERKPVSSNSVPFLY
jgi:hypothetical protein